MREKRYFWPSVRRGHKVAGETAFLRYTSVQGLCPQGPIDRCVLQHFCACHFNCCQKVHALNRGGGPSSTWPSLVVQLIPKWHKFNFYVVRISWTQPRISWTNDRSLVELVQSDLHTCIDTCNAHDEKWASLICIILCSTFFVNVHHSRCVEAVNQLSIKMKTLAQASCRLSLRLLTHDRQQQMLLLCLDPYPLMV